MVLNLCVRETRLAQTSIDREGMAVRMAAFRRPLMLGGTYFLRPTPTVANAF